MARRKKIDTSPFDRINEDGILCLILSYLSLKEAVRTCVLSRRWRYIWTQLPDLEINVENMLHADSFCFMDKKYAAKFRNKFISSVNSFLQHHQGVGVNKFSLNYALHKIHSRHLEAWINFAVASKSKIVYFALGSSNLFDHVHGKKSELCDFPCYLLRSSSVEILALVSCSLKLLPGFDGLSYLKVLNLCQVDVTEEDFRGLLSNCFTLESLRVEGSRNLVALSVSHPLSQLKDLDVVDCKKLKKIDINAVNLTYLYYCGHPVEFLFRESLQLTKACIYFISSNLNYALTILSNNLPHLEVLEFEIRGVSKEFVNLVSNSNRFFHLRHLVWSVSPSLCTRSHLRLPVLLSAAPLLEKLSLHYDSENAEDRMIGRCDQIKRKEASPHIHLKAVDFKGFYCDKWQVMLLLYIFTSATKLESITLRNPSKTPILSYHNFFQRNMEYLMPQLPTNVKLVVV